MLNRLLEILDENNVHIETCLVKKLIIETNHDMTNCLNTLEFVSNNLPLEQVNAVGTKSASIKKVIKEHNLYDSTGNFKFKKDMLASVFDSWDKIIKVRSKFDPKRSIPQLKSIYFT